MEGEVKEGKISSGIYELIADDIVTIIDEAIQNNGNARVLLSGGTSPIPVYQILAQSNLDWSKIQFGLVDERFVPTNHEHSNEDMIRRMFNNEKNKNFQLDGMVKDAFDYGKNGEKIEVNYEKFQNPDLVLLGMGTDGHTASIFPNEKRSDLSYQMNTNTALTQAPSFPYKRISCTPKLIQSAKNLLLLVKGEEKKEILHQSSLNLPIHQFVPYIHKTYIAL